MSNLFVLPLTLGAVVATPGALDLLARHRQPHRPLVERHAMGDWGDVDSEDAAANDSAVAGGGRVLSSFSVGAERLWIITEADRLSTTLLLPSEY